MKIYLQVSVAKEVKRQSRKYKIPVNKAHKDKTKYTRKNKWTIKLPTDY